MLFNYNKHKLMFNIYNNFVTIKSKKYNNVIDIH